MAHVHGAAGAAEVSKHATEALHAAAATGGAVAVVGKSYLGKLFRHPLVLFGLGVAVGYAVHKYRKDIINAANRAVEQGQDFVQQQRENLEDLVAGNRESES